MATKKAKTRSAWSDLTWEERFANGHVDFQASIRDLAKTYGKTVKEVFRKWLDYAAASEASDQSAILWEFEQRHLKCDCHQVAADGQVLHHEDCSTKGGAV